MKLYCAINFSGPIRWAGFVVTELLPEDRHTDADRLTYPFHNSYGLLMVF